MVFKIHESNSFGIWILLFSLVKKENHKQLCQPSCALVIIRSIMVSSMSLAELATKGLFLPWTTGYSSSPCKSREGNSPKLAWLGTWGRAQSAPPMHACSLHTKNNTMIFYVKHHVSKRFCHVWQALLLSLTNLAHLGLHCKLLPRCTHI
jgi:hypothetical protein